MMELLKRLAYRSPCRHRHAVVVLKGGRPIAVGYNHAEKHAEAVALARLEPRQAKGATLISIRMGRDGKLRMARPCVVCLALMYTKRLRRVYFTNRSGELEELMFGGEGGTRG